MKDNKNKEGDWLTLEKYRMEIDRIDEKILSLLTKRQEFAAAIGGLKKSLGVDVISLSREKQILRRVSAGSSKNFSPGAIRNIFSEIISAARAVQHPVTVAYLGPEATFSHQAAVSLFGGSTSFRGSETIEKVFDMVERGICNQGVVPIENSYEGSVGKTLDLLCEYDLNINAELYLRIRHHLLSSGGMENLKYLYSHPMAIAQCRSWIKANLPEVKVKETESTSAAARMAAEKPNAAAVGSRLAAIIYGLNLLEEDIEDNPQNVTRFLSLGKDLTGATGRDKTSLLFSLNHRPGALYRALEPLSQRKINMTRIESRPIKSRNWEYMFFVDIEGHEQENNVCDAIGELEERCAFIKRLGSYPLGGEQ